MRSLGSMSFGGDSKDAKKAWDTSGAVKPDPAALQRVHAQLTHHTSPFKDMIWTEREWKAHHSWTRYLLEPMVLCAAREGARRGVESI